MWTRVLRQVKTSHLENIGSQDVPRTSSSNVPRRSPKDPVWTSRGRPDLTSRERSNLTSWGRPNLTLKGRSREMDLGCPQDVLRTPSRGSSEYSNLMSQKNFNFSFRTNSIDQIYLKAFQQSRCIENPVKLLR